ncbi:MAG: hypothetical protein QM739_03370 [Propionivibrio sp.]
MFEVRRQHDRLNEAYGFGLFPAPRYQPASQGAWRITTHLPGPCDGYLGTVGVEARTVLKRQREVWMSIGLLEMESHAWHVHCARGGVVTAGLGMGMYVYAAAMKPEVDLVIAAEISPDIIALMRQAADMDHWPCRDKVKIVEVDVLADDGRKFAARIDECTGGRPVDYLYADIWPNFPADEAPAQSALMARALRPKTAGWWGQELSLAHYCRRESRQVDEESIRAYFQELGVPIPGITAGYAAFCRDAIHANGMNGRVGLLQRFDAWWRGKTGK